MTTLDIRIQSLKEWEKQSLWPELHQSPYKDIPVSGCGILQEGTAQGDTSILFHGLDSEGVVIAFQLTGNMFRAVAAAMKGAEQRWLDEAKKEAD